MTRFRAVHAACAARHAGGRSAGRAVRDWSAGELEGGGRGGPPLRAWDLPLSDVPGKISIPAAGVATDRDGGLWIATTGGAAHFDPAKETWRIYTVADGLAANEFSGIFTTRDGRILLGTWAKGISIWEPGNKSLRRIPTADNDFVAPSEMFEDRVGDIWLSGFGSELYRWPIGSSRLEPQQLAQTSDPAPQGARENQLSDQMLFYDGNDNLWSTSVSRSTRTVAR